MQEANLPLPGPSRVKGRFSPPLRFFAQLVSYLFHPLFISSYVMGFLLFLHPYAFTGFDHRLRVLRFLHVLIFNALFPGFVVFLAWRLKFIQSMHMRTAKERIIPYVINMIFYWWTWYAFKSLGDMPDFVVHFTLGAFLAICGAWFCNIYYKISMHSIAAGGALLFIFLFTFSDPYASGLYLSVAVLVTGLICTARLISGEHTLFELYSGLFVGMLAQYLAWMF
jgi:hypothetical protein